MILQQRTAYNDYYNCILRDAKVCSAPPKLNRVVTASENGGDRGQPRRRVSYTALNDGVQEQAPLPDNAVNQSNAIPAASDLVVRANTMHEENLSALNNMASEMRQMTSTMNAFMGILMTN